MNLKNLLSTLLLVALQMTVVHGQEKPTIKISKLPLNKPIESIGRTGGITIDKLGYLYVANFMNSVYRVSPIGEVELFSNGLYGASGNTIDAEGNLIQSNFYGNTIVKIDRDGKKELFAKDLVGPVGILFNKKNELIVCNCRNNSILKITAKKEKEYLAYGNLFACPNGVAIDKDGNMYVVNFLNDNIIKIPIEGKPSVLATVGTGSGNAHIVFHKNHLFVAKINTNQIYKVSLTGATELMAGDGSPVKNTINNEKVINRPNGIAVDPKGNLFVTRINGKWRGGEKSEIEVLKVETKNKN